MKGLDAEGDKLLLGGGPAPHPAITHGAHTGGTPGTPGTSGTPGTPFTSTTATPSLSDRSDQAFSTTHVVDAIRDAASSHTALRISAGGGWLGAGRPIERPTRRLDVSALRGIVEYNPGDLTLTARAATTLAEIDDATRAHGQWLPLDPIGGASDTVGATLATASSGALAAAMGLPRDLALGIEFVDGRGVVVRAGGKVVKNVAGFDLVRLTVGAWGTLGVITEVTVRLRARPEQSRTAAVVIPRDVRSCATLLGALRGGPLTPLAAELLSAPLAAGIGAGDGADDVILVRIAGNAASLSAQRAFLASFADCHDVVDETWDALRRVVAPVGASLRLSQRPSRLAELWFELRAASREIAGALFHASLERGVARLVVEEPVPEHFAPIVGSLAERWRIVGELLPAPAWRVLPAVGHDRISAGIRAAFDPHAILNPGLLTSVA